MPNRETSLSLPPRWCDDSLSSFVDQAFRNTLATFVRKRDATQILMQLDQVYMCIGENLDNASDVIGAILLVRSHSAFRGACRMSMSGQVPEAFPSMRICLEYALYALHINLHPGLGETWIARHDNSDSLRAVRREFKYCTIIKTLQRQDNHLCSIVTQLYEKTIDFGAHPNERAITGSMEMHQGDKETRLMQIQLHGDTLSLDYVLKTTAQTGLGSLCIFQLLFKERFQILGLNSVIDRLRKRV